MPDVEMARYAGESAGNLASSIRRLQMAARILPAVLNPAAAYGYWSLPSKHAGLGACRAVCHDILQFSARVLGSGWAAWFDENFSRFHQIAKLRMMEG
jgi:hypothetical protein